MSDAPKSRDPFRPLMPNIPGVSQAAGDERDGDGKASARKALLVTMALAAGALLAWWALRPPRPGAAIPASQPKASSPTAEGASTETAPQTPARAGTRGVSAVEVASLRELAKPWSSVRFVFRGPLTDETAPAMVIRLPGGRADRTASYWAFCLKAPFGQCELEYLTDLSKLASQYGYRAPHPMVGNPCTGTVYDPLRVGPIAGGPWARGEIVHGAGIRPPIAIELRIQGDHLMATRME